MDEQLLIKLISYIESASPELWRIANQQVEVEIYQSQIWMWGLGIAAGILFSLWIAVVVWQVVFADKYSKDSEMVIATAIPTVLPALALAIFAFSNYVDVVSMQLNPEYYAIKFIIELLQTNQ